VSGVKAERVAVLRVETSPECDGVGVGVVVGVCWPCACACACVLAGVGSAWVGVGPGTATRSSERERTERLPEDAWLREPCSSEAAEAAAEGVAALFRAAMDPDAGWCDVVLRGAVARDAERRWAESRGRAPAAAVLMRLKRTLQALSVWTAATTRAVWESSDGEEVGTILDRAVPMTGKLSLSCSIEDSIVSIVFSACDSCDDRFADNVWLEAVEEGVGGRTLT
jgi:hypothetical protein